ncbi:MAG: DNA primase [Methanocellales archaeon]|nr:DNA primase [Methanocellales archaeon]MDD3421464.1 DNA primase [Methanocellales archaeon]MDD4898666.1 DNA primase [Methanocellales archaeon]MDD5447346.1 DNA primase [Methanocellales archaeon]
MDDLDRLQKIEQIICDIKDLSNEGAVIIVEGKKDRDALNELGISDQISLASYQPLLNFAEGISRKTNQAIILTDWDSQGKKMAKKISGYLQASNTKPNNLIRNKIKKLVRNEIKDVEGLSGYVNSLRREVYNRY